MNGIDPEISTRAFEELARAKREERYELRLYVAGSTPRSLEAIRNITQLCETELAGRCDLEVIDAYSQPGRAREDQIVALPTLIKRSPAPFRRLIGDLSHRGRVRKNLGLEHADHG